MTALVIFVIMCYILSMIRIGAVRNTHASVVNRNFYIVTMCLLLFVLIGFRSYEIGTDTLSYKKTFDLIAQIEFTNTNWLKKYLLTLNEPLFIILNIIVCFISKNFTVFLCVYAAFYVLSIGYIIWNYSTIPRWSFIALLSLGYVYFSMAGIRQTIAMSVLLFSYKFIRDRKIIPFLLLVFIAFGFHNTSIVFLLAYPLSNLKVTWKRLFVLVGAYFIMLFNKNLVYTLLFDVLKWERLSAYSNLDSSLSLSGAIIQIAIFLFALFFTEKESDNDIRPLLNLSFLGCLFQIFTPIIGEFFRVSMYFAIFNIILIPTTASNIKNINNRKAVMVLVPFILLLYFFGFSGLDSSIIPYRFIGH